MPSVMCCLYSHVNICHNLIRCLFRTCGVNSVVEWTNLFVYVHNIWFIKSAHCSSGLIRLSNISLKVQIILSANSGWSLDGMYVIWRSVKYFWKSPLFFIAPSPSVMITFRGPPILLMHSMNPKATSLSVFPFIGTIAQYFKTSQYIAFPPRTAGSWYVYLQQNYLPHELASSAQHIYWQLLHIILLL